ncbi:MAG: peptidoglycan DD-metalloendopeptidase family protein [Bacteroidota bacterium]
MRKKTLIILLLSIAIIFFGILAYLSFYMPRQPAEEIKISADMDTTLLKPKPRLEFGLPADSFTISSALVRANQNLSGILMQYGINPVTIDQIVKKSRGVFDFRKIRGGNTYHVFQDLTDTIPEVNYFVYEQDHVNYVVIDLVDSVAVYRGEKEVSTVENSVSGVINTSLWNAMTDAEVSPMLAIELSEIFAWTIDFFGLQEGDTFKVIYDEMYVDSTFIGLGHIHTAYMNHMGEDFYAIPFVQDSIRSFYDMEGQSLRKAFLKAPLRFSRISSRFSHSRMHPVLKIRRPHRGVDYAAPSGTPVYAVGDGRIVAKAWDSKGGGNYVKIKHNGVYTTGYLHLQGFAKGLKTNQFVSQGELIGYVGKTGLATGPHLDFRFYKNGQAVDPLKIEAPPVEPVKAENLEEYNAIKQKWFSRLNRL